MRGQRERRENKAEKNMEKRKKTTQKGELGEVKG